jgi:probable rRNA maturation factor
VKKIVIRNLQRKIAINTASLQCFGDRALAKCRSYSPRCRRTLSRMPEIFVLLISDRRMSRLHVRFLGRAGSTDVITFDHGEIFISVETAFKNALRFKTSTLREIQLYIVHGLLHLCRFDDQNPSAAEKMRRAQRKILATAGR